MKETDYKPKQGKRITIAMTHAFSVLWMAHKFSHFKAQHPDIDLAIIVIDDLGRIGDDSNIDGFLGLDPSTDENCVSTELFYEIIFPVCNAKYLAMNPHLTKNEHFLEAQLLHLKGSQAHRGFGWKQWLINCFCSQ